MENQLNESNNDEDLTNKRHLLREQISSTLANESIEQAIKHINAEIGNVFQFDRVSIRYYDSTLKLFSDITDEYKKDESVPSSEFKAELDEFLYNELSKNKTIVIDNIDEVYLPEKIRLAMKEDGVKSEIIVPIFYKKDFLAVIFMTSTQVTKAFTKEYIDFMGSISDQIAVGLNMFSLNEKLKNTIEVEKTVISIIYEIRRFSSHHEVFDYILNKLINIFNIHRAIHLHYDEKNNQSVENEAIKNLSELPLRHKQILDESSTRELMPKAYQDILIINDVGSDIGNENLRNFLLSYNIQSFMIYPVSGKYPELVAEKLFSATMLCSSQVRRWSSDEALNFKLIIDSTTASYFGLLQRNTYEDLKQTFLATLTHDLKSPLIGTQKALEMILSKPPETPLSNFSEYLNDMLASNAILLYIASNLLAVYQYEAGEIKLNLEPVNIDYIFYEAIKSVHYLAEENKSKIITIIEPSLPLVKADKNEIARVVINLLSNAISHNKKTTDLTINAEKFNDEVKISVMDNGSGIPESEKNKIFQRYPTEKRKIGSGLGLYLSKQIIENHHGKIWFETEEGKGTTFYFTLPVT